jgi:hypothetical protein
LRDGRFGTAITCLAFTQLPESSSRESGMASPTGLDDFCTPVAFTVAA